MLLDKNAGMLSSYRRRRVRSSGGDTFGQRKLVEVATL